ncbi:putative ct20 family protein [Erysiphe necator]|uniref:Putative ct20 family protein n=1 Tax=Uncinula necator TaxID=52586 RepID=A0A0B1PHA3_UNCNE|nr:putative ct20 family protein [Erysiphe necator]
MPPRKKSRGNLRVDSIPTAYGEETMETSVILETEKPPYDILKDPWTDEQETSLFKGIVKWKPAGIHKHFRMIAISEYLRNHGYDPTIEKHTRIPGIWEKLKTLYNLEHIDYIENNIDHPKSGEKAGIFLEFKLPEEDYDEIQFLRGRRNTSEAPSEITSSPLPDPKFKHSPSPLIKKKRKRKESLVKRRTSSVDETEEAKYSPSTPSFQKQVRRGRPPGRPPTKPVLKQPGRPPGRPVCKQFVKPPGRPPGRPPKKKLESMSRAPSNSIEELGDTEDVEGDSEDEESITLGKEKTMKSNNNDATSKRKSKRIK